MSSRSSTLLVVLVLCNVVCPVWMLNMGIIALIPTPTTKGVPRTAPPNQALVKSTAVHKPLYKDYYSKTSVIVTFPVSTILFQDQDVNIIYNQTEDVYYTEYEPSLVRNFTERTTYLMPSRSSVFKYEDHEWATETQIYTTALNATITTVVENTVPFL